MKDINPTKSMTYKIKTDKYIKLRVKLTRQQLTFQGFVDQAVDDFLSKKIKKAKEGTIFL